MVHLLVDFNFEILYRPDALQGKVDTLSCRTKYIPKEGDNVATQQTTTLLKPNQLWLQLNSIDFV